jgi:hypothetical protein
MWTMDADDRGGMMVVSERVGKHVKLPACLVILHKKFECQVFSTSRYLHVAVWNLGLGVVADEFHTATCGYLDVLNI